MSSDTGTSGSDVDDDGYVDVTDSSGNPISSGSGGVVNSGSEVDFGYDPGAYAALDATYGPDAAIPSSDNNPFSMAVAGQAPAYAVAVPVARQDPAYAVPAEFNSELNRFVPKQTYEQEQARDVLIGKYRDEQDALEETSSPFGFGNWASSGLESLISGLTLGTINPEFDGRSLIGQDKPPGMYVGYPGIGTVVPHVSLTSSGVGLEPGLAFEAAQHLSNKNWSNPFSGGRGESLSGGAPITRTQEHGGDGGGGRPYVLPTSPQVTAPVLPAVNSPALTPYQNLKQKWAGNQFLLAPITRQP